VDGTPTTRYARNGAAHLAYQVTGDGPVDIVLVESWVHHVEAFWSLPEQARQWRRLAAIGRLVTFDRRGTGMSDPVGLDELPDLDEQVDDLRAVMDAAGVERAVVLGFQDGGELALQLAATTPERCESLVLFNAAARYLLADDYPFGIPEAMMHELVDRQAADWAEGDPAFLKALVPSRADDEVFVERLMRFGRSAVSPGAVAH